MEYQQIQYHHLYQLYGLALQDINNKDVRAKNSYFRHLDPLE
ncbi:hypothetical protein [Campylobacter devanensis]|nr:hypothetical protein [Campylobacter sp. P0108]